MVQEKTHEVKFQVAVLTLLPAECRFSLSLSLSLSVSLSLSLSRELSPSRGRTIRSQDLVELPIPPVTLRCPNIRLGRCRQWRRVSEDHGCVIRLIVHRPVGSRGAVRSHACPKAHGLRREGHLNRVGGVDVVVTLVLRELPLCSATRRTSVH